MPMIPFMGVRISWLIFARKRDFAAFALSAASLAVTRTPSAASRRAISVRRSSFARVTSATRSRFRKRSSRASAMLRLATRPMAASATR